MTAVNMNIPRLPEHLPSGEWSEQAVLVLQERYLKKNGQGEATETPDQMCWRVAWTVARAESNWGEPFDRVVEEKAAKFYRLMVSRKFLPNSPTLANAGKNSHALSACYVLPVPDSLAEIGEAVKQQMLVHQSGGGTGFAFSRLRPRGAFVQSTQGVASGPVEFMKLFDAATEAVKQGGMRRGANMGILLCNHPDILEFIHCKKDGGISNFNISVGITDEFVDALNGRGLLVPDGHPSNGPSYYGYKLIDPHTSKVTSVADARYIWAEITEMAWATGDPGLFFLDRVNSTNPIQNNKQYRIEACNPCGEQELAPFDACNLGSINLAEFYTPESGKGRINWDDLAATIHLAVRFLDDVVEINPYPLPQIHDMVHSLRRIGLGVMGWADLLFKLRTPYDSDQAVELAGQIMQFINRHAHQQSMQLAEERGAFPMWSESIYANAAKIRNAAITTIAPTGTISIIAGCSSGIEPAFALAFRHEVGERKMQFFNPTFNAALTDLQTRQEKRGEGDSVREYVLQTGSAQTPMLPASMMAVFKTAPEIAPEWHLKHQAAFQQHTDNGVSKTIILPESATVEDIDLIYRTAYGLGCKGITVFRLGSKDGAAVLKAGSGEENSNQMEKVVVVWGEPDSASSGYTSSPLIPQRPISLQGVSYKQPTPLGTGYITVNHDSDSQQPLEVFIDLGKAGTESKAVAEALGRVISFALRLNAPMNRLKRLEEIAQQLTGIGGGNGLGYGKERVSSLPDAVGKALMNEVERMQSLESLREDFNSILDQLSNAKIAALDQDTLSGVMARARRELDGIRRVGISTDARTPEELFAEQEKRYLEETQRALNVQQERQKQAALSANSGPQHSAADLCPDCGNAALFREEGCRKCYSCGYSEC